MEHLTSEQLASLRRQLEGERDHLRAHLVSAAEDSEEEQFEQQDAAAAEAQRQQEMRLTGHAHIRLRLVEAALARMDQRVYGECEESGEPIPFGRLQIEPTTRYTVDAAEALAEAGEAGDGSRDDPGGY